MDSEMEIIWSAKAKITFYELPMVLAILPLALARG